MEEKLYKITLTESQLKLIANAVEDWSRFLSGQCEMNYATNIVDNWKEAQDNLEKFVRPYIVPELANSGASYGWSGGDCPNKTQHDSIAMSYGIYREIRYYFANQNKTNNWNCYLSPTLRCKEQGPLIQIEEIK